MEGAGIAVDHDTAATQLGHRGGVRGIAWLVVVDNRVGVILVPSHSAALQAGCLRGCVKSLKLRCRSVR